MERSFFVIFEDLTDPRSEKGRKYRLIDVIILSIYGTLCGFNDFSNMAYYLKKRETELIEKLDIETGVPSHDVFSDVFRALNINQFMERFVEWVKQVTYKKTGNHIAIDGKAVRAAADKASKGNIPYVISAFMCENGLSIGQKQIEEKTNEITQIPDLLDLIDVKDNTITIDAIGTQKAIMKKITEKGGHYCLQLKKNHPEVLSEVSLYFDYLLKNKGSSLESYEEKTNCHGRKERRTYYTVSDEAEIRDVLPKDWATASCLGMAVLERRIGENVSCETHFHVMDIPRTAEEYARFARNHWQIENGLHWILDIHFGEDRSTAREENAIANLTLLRKIAFNLIKLMPEESKKSTKKKIVDFMMDVDLFKKLIYETLPSAKLSELK